jgi:hypothetical protein
LKKKSNRLWAEAGAGTAAHATPANPAIGTARAMERKPIRRELSTAN